MCEYINMNINFIDVIKYIVAIAMKILTHLHACMHGEDLGGNCSNNIFTQLCVCVIHFFIFFATVYLFLLLYI